MTAIFRQCAGYVFKTVVTDSDAEGLMILDCLFLNVLSKFRETTNFMSLFLRVLSKHSTIKC